MNAPPHHVIVAAILTAEQSPCAKSHRGVVLFDPALDKSRPLARGFNGQPRGFVCDGSVHCRKSCAKLCLHAEDRAIREALVVGDDLTTHELVHVEVVGGKVVACDGPKCWQCSRLVLDAGVRGVWLYERVEDDRGDREEWVFYTAPEFHAATLKRCELPVVVAS